MESEHTVGGMRVESQGLSATWLYESGQEVWEQGLVALGELDQVLKGVCELSVSYTDCSGRGLEATVAQTGLSAGGIMRMGDAWSLQEQPLRPGSGPRRWADEQ